MEHPLVIVKSRNSELERYSATLKSFPSNSICEGAVDALQLLETNPAHVVVIEMELPDMAGIEVADAIRDIDGDRDHFTYIILVGPDIGTETEHSYEQTIDVFVSEGDPHILRLSAQAGARIAEHVNSLNEANMRLLQEREELILGQLKDPLTGLGNRRQAEQSLKDAIRHIESRGGAVCFLMISVGNYEEVLARFDETIANELIKAIADRIDNLVRPMDIVTYFGAAHFALVLLQPSIDQCTAECYERIYDGVRLKSYKTSVGFQSATIGMSICASHAEHGAPNAEKMIAVAESNLNEALAKQAIHVKHLTEQLDG